MITFLVGIIKIGSNIKIIGVRSEDSIQAMNRHYCFQMNIDINSIKFIFREKLLFSCMYVMKQCNKGMNKLGDNQW